MAIQTGIARRVAAKKESAWGTLPGSTGGQRYRRVQSTINLLKNAYESQEIRSDYQVADYRHGTRRVEGAISGEFSGGTYQSFFEAGFRKASAAVSDLTSLTLDVAASGANYTVTRGSGSWVTDGVRVGMVVRATAGLNASSLNRNMLVVGLTATVMTVLVLNGLSLAIESSVAGCTIAVPGKWLIVPSSSHTDDSFTIEHWDSDVSVSQRFTGCKVNSVGLRLPASGLSTVEFGFLGKDMEKSGSAYFSSPAAETTSAIYAAVNGALLVDGVAVASVTAVNINIAGGMTTGETVGSNTTPDVFPGRVRVSGDMQVYYEDGSFIDAFKDETELSLSLALLAGTGGDSEFVTLLVPRIKVGSATQDDGEKGLVQSVSFMGLLLPATTGYDATTIAMQDSLFA